MTAIGAGACDACLARSALLARLAGPLDRAGPQLATLLGAPDAELIAAVTGGAAVTVRREHAGFDADAARAAAAAAGVITVCRCTPAYPAALRELTAPPAVLHLAGAPEALAPASPGASVAVVGARDASPYGLDVARALGRGVAEAGLVVISGMARGVDAAAHAGALEAGGLTVAVLAAGAERPYPASARALYRRIVATGAVVSELPPGTPARRWTFPARNRLIAALAALTVVVEGRPASGALLTAAAAVELGRPLGAVPGHVTSPLAAGPHALLAAGARVITGTRDVLALLAETGLTADVASEVTGRDPGVSRAGPEPARLDPPRRALYDALAEGQPSAVALQRAGLDAERGLAALAALELDGLIRREPGGAWAVRAR
ncbi:MAG TPA: DNA-processing protein DprA [Solirubrobacteraceae bacterium]|nr:DNA-processing protein DprA [Solirubrobacteraceae bacterium]